MSGEHPRPRPTNLVPIIRRVLTSVAKSAAHSTNIEINLPAELMALAEADRIEKVIENLVINALEAMSPGKGILTVTGGPRGQGQVSFSISDSGPGITRDFQERRLFHPFATTKVGGVGLGLYTCREVIRAHGGSIEVDSEPGVGTTFRVVLPSGKTGAQ
jgi:signal transduction histidine kinase